MSKYAILVLINLPLIVTGIIDAITDYKASRTISKRRCIIQVIFWLCVGTALVLVEPVYNTLIRANLTDSPPLSLFDVTLLTIIVFALFAIMKLNEKVIQLNKKLARIHERMAILAAKDQS